MSSILMVTNELKTSNEKGSDVPLGFISLTENLMMMAMAIWMMLKCFV